MRSLVCRLTLVILAALGPMSALAFAQGSTKTTLSGSVVDSSGGVLPGATVTVKNNRTGVVTTTVTSTSGVFDVPAIDPGNYTVTVTLSGFKTASLTDIELLSGVARGVKVTLE